MRNLTGLLFLLAVMVTAGANATTINYSFTADFSREYYTSSPSDTLDASQQLMGGGNVISGGLTYNPTAGYVSPAGPFSYYSGAASGLSASVSGAFNDAATGNTLSAAGMGGFVANDDSFGGAPIDMFILIAANSLVGFAVGEYVMVSARMVFSDYEATVFSDETLPGTLTTPGFDWMGVNLFFENAQGVERVVQFRNLVLTAASVPEPGALALVLVGLFGLFMVRRRLQA